MPDPKKDDWFLFLAELKPLQTGIISQIMKFASDNEVCTAWVLDEGTPNSVLSVLVDAKKIFPVSRKAKAQFIRFLLTSRLRCPCFDRRLETVRWDKKGDATLNNTARELLTRMAKEMTLPAYSLDRTERQMNEKNFYQEFTQLSKRPKLSICISTFNRAKFLDLSLKNLDKIWPLPSNEVEILICDNASTDQTGRIVQPYLTRKDITYVTNIKNMGMLGNLRVTVGNAHGRYIWILGDDDLLYPEAIHTILKIIDSHQDVPLIYLSYTYTMKHNYEINELESTMNSATITTREGKNHDMYAPIMKVAANNYNFFTAIYALIFRRDHALRAYSQYTGERPFSSLASCVPTTLHVLERLRSENIYWVGHPQVMINGNVSYRQYLFLHYLERVTEYMDIFEYLGANAELMAPYWAANCQMIRQCWEEMFTRKDIDNSLYFSALRVMLRLRPVKALDIFIPEIRQIYEKAYFERHHAARIHPDVVFASWNPGNLETHPELFPEPL